MSLNLCSGQVGLPGLNLYSGQVLTPYLWLVSSLISMAESFFHRKAVQFNETRLTRIERLEDL